MKRILATGLAVAAAAIAYAWWRGGEETAALGEPLVFGELRHRTIPAASDGAPLLVLLHERGGSPRELLWPELVDALDAQGSNAPPTFAFDSRR